MVITSRLPSCSDHDVEKLHMQECKKQMTSRKKQVPLPLRPPPPLHRLHSATSNVAVAKVDPGTPPLAFSPGQACRRPSKNNQQAQAKQQQQQLQRRREQNLQQKHAPIISWGGKCSQSTAMAVATDMASVHGSGGSRMAREGDEDDPLPWPPTLSPLQLQPRASHQHHQQLHLPNPSFGDEDFGILAGCIENLDSMGSIDDNSVAFVDSIRQSGNSGDGAYSHATATSRVSTGTEAAVRAAAGELELADNSCHGKSYATTDTHQSRATEPFTEKDAASMHLTNNTTSPHTDAVVVTTMETKIMTPPSVVATDEDFMRQSHSSESVVVTSPSRNGDSNCSRSTESHPPSSPEAFLLITPVGMSGAPSPTSHHHIMHTYDTSPTSLHWDEDYSNMDQFFNDMTDVGTTTSYLSAGGSGGQERVGVTSSRNGGLDDVTAEPCVDSSGGKSVRFSPLKRRKCDALYDCRSPLLEDDGNENNYVATPQHHHHQVQPEDSSNLTSTNSSQLLLRNVMKSPHTTDAPDLKTTKGRKAKKKNTNLKKNKNRKSLIKSKLLLAPREQSDSSTPSSSSPSTPAADDAAAAAAAPSSHSQLRQEKNKNEIQSVELNPDNDPMPPSKATYEQCDNVLYHKLRNTHPPTEMTLPPSLVPSIMTGNRLVTLQGSTKQQKEHEIEDCALYSTFAFYKFLHGIYPALEGCTYLLPGLHQRKAKDHNSSRLKEMKDGIDWRSKIHVSSFGSFELGDMPGMIRSDKNKLNKDGLKIAKQRVECAVYAFGGTVSRRTQSSSPQLNKPDTMSIFRVKKDSFSTIQSALTKSSSKSGSSGEGDGESKSRNNQRSSSRSIGRQRKYEEKLRQQYFEHGDHLSWDVQDNLSLTLEGGNTFDEDDGILLQWSGGSYMSEGTCKEHQPKQQQQKKNKCKKCGQRKQGHVCPYSSSMQRSIGIMVYPCANAHVADEPGHVAPALCEMNNFISIKGSASFESNNGDDKMLILSSLIASSERRNVVPQVLRSTSCINDAATKIISIPFRRKTLLESSSTVLTSEPNDSKQVIDAAVACHETSETGSTELLFQPTMEITIDQYRSITPKDTFNTHDDNEHDYVYPHVPLTFTQRKSLSDALFSLSKRVPNLTEECALVLTEARKNDQWDLAVAELMTQVLCVLHCSPTNDFTLEGLRQYLLTLGIVC